MRILIFIIVQLVVTAVVGQTQEKLPKVFSDHLFDKLGADLRQQAKTASCSLTLHNSSTFSEEYKKQLKSNIIKYAASEVDHSLDLKIQVKSSLDMGSFVIENITYQSQEGIFVTANLYRPKSEGVYPAVITTHGHWANGRRTEIVQTTAQLLALNGFVCLAVDAWGVGERATNPLEHEYHGSNLGASLMNVGNTLLGLQLIDNRRAVDLLCSLPYVDAKNIGATGASGGGNQAMWLAAMDERVKAVVPVVSVGTFESYVMNSNCVCELLPHGLTLTEEDAILGLIAPRALNIFTAMNDANPSFVYSQMQKSYRSVFNIYKQQNAVDNISYSLFNRGHGYWDEMQMEMLSFFTKHLKKDQQVDLIDVSEVKLQEIKKMATYPNGNLAKEVLNTETYLKIKGAALKQQLLSTQSINPLEKKEELKQLLSLSDKSNVKDIRLYPVVDDWGKIIIETQNGHLIPILYKVPQQGNDYTIVAHSQGKANIPAEELNDLIIQKDGVVLVDLWGIGESESKEANKIDGALPAFHTLSRTSLWLGQPVMGRWVDELNMVVEVVKEKLHGQPSRLFADRETTVAALFYSILSKDGVSLQLDQLPSSYVFENRENVDFYNMAIHIPSVLLWGDICLALALSKNETIVSNPKTMSGRNAVVKTMAEEVNTFCQKMDLGKSKIDTNQNILTIK